MAKRGPKPQYERVASNKKGAPLLAVRLETAVYSHIKSKPEGPRAYVERLVTEDADRTGEVLGGTGKGPIIDDRATGQSKDCPNKAD